MRSIQGVTPQPSVNGDEVNDMDADDDMYYEEVEVDELEELMNDGTDEVEEDHSILTFDKHQASIFCCDFHPSGKYAVTGGQDDKAYVWSVETGQVIMDCTGHEDSVIFVGFCYNAAYLATVDMKGIIKIWKCNFEATQNEPWPVVFEYEAEELSWCQWHFGAWVLFCGALTGDVFIFNIPSGETKFLQGFNEKAECGKLLRDGMRLAVGYADGSLKVWDIKTEAVLQQIPAKIHTIRVTALDASPDNNLLASISTDGKVVLSTPNNGKVVGQLEYESDLETVAFHPDPQIGYFALGTLSGSVSIWDVSKQMIRNHCAKSDEDDAAGVTKMIWVKNHLITGCLDGSIRAYEGNSGKLSLTLKGTWSEILDINYNEKENLILTACEDGRARIFKYEEKQ